MAKDLVLRKFPALFKKFNSMIRANENNLFWYMMFLRLTPLIPNWFVNLGSPLVGMPYLYFIIASFFGTYFLIIKRINAKQFYIDSNRINIEINRQDWSEPESIHYINGFRLFVFDSNIYKQKIWEEVEIEGLIWISKRWLDRIIEEWTRVIRFNSL